MSIFIDLPKKYDLHTIQVVSPVSTSERLEKNAAIAKGFVYFTARQGITGAKKELDPEIKTHLRKIKQYFPIPVAVGFGISKREHIAALLGKADIAIVGSAVIDIIAHSSQKERLQKITDFISRLKMLK